MPFLSRFFPVTSHEHELHDSRFTNFKSYTMNDSRGVEFLQQKVKKRLNVGS